MVAKLHSEVVHTLIYADINAKEVSKHIHLFIFKLENSDQ